MDDIVSRENFTKIFNKNNYKLGIELGSYCGEFAKHIVLIKIWYCQNLMII